MPTTSRPLTDVCTPPWPQQCPRPACAIAESRDPAHGRPRAITSAVTTVTSWLGSLSARPRCGDAADHSFAVRIHRARPGDTMTNRLRNSACPRPASSGSNTAATFFAVGGCAFTRITPQCLDNGSTAQSPKCSSSVTSVRSRLADFSGTHDVVALPTQQVSQLRPQALVQVKMHNESGRIQHGHFGVQDGLPCVSKSCLEVSPRQFRVAAQERIPRLPFGQLLQQGGHGDPRASNHRLPTAHARIDFNSVAHALDRMPLP